MTIDTVKIRREDLDMEELAILEENLYERINFLRTAIY